MRLIFDEDLSDYHNSQMKFIIDKFRKLTRIDNTKHINLIKEENLLEGGNKIKETSKNILRDLFGLLSDNHNSIITILKV